MIHEELEKTLKRAFEEAKKRQNEFVTLEHLLLALTYDPMASHVLYHCGADLKKLQRDLTDFLQEHIPMMISEGFTSDPKYTLGVQFVLQYAAAHGQSAGKRQIDGGDVLVALYQEKESHAVYFLETQNISRYDVVRYISHKVSKVALIPAPTESDFESDEPGVKRGDPLARFCVNLNHRARKGKIDPLIGRNKEMDRAVHILSRRRKNNPIFVGDAGVGKTALVEGLALQIVNRKVPDCLKEAQIYSLDMAALLAGTKFRGEFEERLKSVVQSIVGRSDRILFIDEIHTIIGAGAVSGSPLDATHILKPSLANGEIKCIGTTTYKEYRTLFEKDHALSRRFQQVEVGEPSEEATFQILRGLKKNYESFHGVVYSDGALKAAVTLSSKYIRDRFLPDKAIDVIDETGAEVRLKKKKGGNRVTPREIEATVSRMARVPTETIKVDDRKRLVNLSRDLKLLIYGQDQAIGQVVESIQMSRAGLSEPNKPIGSFLFAGPTGVGKTELARQLARQLGVEFIRFDMSEYMEKHAVARLIGSPPGYVGFEQGGLLTEAVHRTPHAVLLLDEIEKAHEDIYNILLQVMDYATLTDNNGRKSDFRHLILIMTTNLGARDSMARTIGFEKKEYEDKSLKAIEKGFSPEFRNRLTGIVRFNPLESSIVEQIVSKMVAELEQRLKERGIVIHLEPSARAWLAEKGFDSQFGARPIRRLIESEIAKPLSTEILFGKLQGGGSVDVDLVDGKIVFKFVPTRTRARETVLW